MPEEGTRPWELENGNGHDHFRYEDSVFSYDIWRRQSFIGTLQNFVQFLSMFLHIPIRLADSIKSNKAKYNVDLYSAYIDISAEFLPLYNPANRKIRLIFG